VFDKAGIGFKPIFQKKKLESLIAFSITAKSKSHLFKLAFTICKKIILLGHVELVYLMFQMAW